MPRLAFITCLLSSLWVASGRFLTSSGSANWVLQAEPTISPLPLKRTKEGWYSAEVKLGDSVSHLLVDTGSSNLWTRASNHVSKNSSGQALGKFSAQYGRGSVSGNVIEESVLLDLASNKTHKCHLGLATKESDFWSKQSTIDGILGLGCSSEDSLVDALGCVVPPAARNVFSLGPRPHRVFCLQLTPEGGSLHLGSVPQEVQLNLVSMPAAQDCDHWSVPLAALSVESADESVEKLQIENAEAILDSGSNGIIGPTFAVIKLARLLGASPSKAGEGYGGEVTFYEVPCDSAANLPTLRLVLGDKSGATVSVALKGNDLVAPAEGDEDVCHLRVAGWETQSWILGAVFLTHLQAVVFDVDTGSVALAPSRTDS